MSAGGDDAAVAGLRLSLREEAGGVAADFLPGPEHHGAPGFLHGGVAATALDEIMAAACYVTGGLHVVTATLELRYRRPVPLDGRPVRLEARREHGGARRHRVSGRLLLGDGTLAVEGKGIFVAAPSVMRGASG